MTLRSDLRLVRMFGLVFLCGCAASGPLTMAFYPMYGQPREQIELDIRACQQQARQASVYDPFVLPAHRNIQPQPLRVDVSCRTKLGYIIFLSHGRTPDQLEADRQVCVPAAMRAKNRLSDDDLKSIVDCMLGRGYFVAGPNFARSPG